jgi:hypothetical protein
MDTLVIPVSQETAAKLLQNSIKNKETGKNRDGAEAKIQEARETITYQTQEEEDEEAEDTESNSEEEGDYSQEEQRQKNEDAKQGRQRIWTRIYNMKKRYQIITNETEKGWREIVESNKHEEARLGRAKLWKALEAIKTELNKASNINTPYSNLKYKPGYGQEDYTCTDKNKRTNRELYEEAFQGRRKLWKEIYIIEETWQENKDEKDAQNKREQEREEEEKKMQKEEKKTRSQKHQQKHRSNKTKHVCVQQNGVFIDALEEMKRSQARMQTRMDMTERHSIAREQLVNAEFGKLKDETKCTTNDLQYRMEKQENSDMRQRDEYQQTLRKQFDNNRMAIATEARLSRLEETGMKQDNETSIKRRNFLTNNMTRIRHQWFQGYPSARQHYAQQNRLAAKYRCSQYNPYSGF